MRCPGMSWTIVERSSPATTSTAPAKTTERGTAKSRAWASMRLAGIARTRKRSPGTTWESRNITPAIGTAIATCTATRAAREARSDPPTIQAVINPPPPSSRTADLPPRHRHPLPLASNRRECALWAGDAL